MYYIFTGNPDDYYNGEDCLSMQTGYNGRLNDVHCDAVFPYVCEYYTGTCMLVSSIML